MALVFKYIIGVILFGGFAVFAVKSIVSLIASVRDWLAKKKSKKLPDEGKEQNVNVASEESGKEVDGK